MSSSITDFKNAITRNKGFAKPNRFKLEITSVPGWSGSTSDLCVFCETVNFPGKQINTIDYDIGIRRPLKIPTNYTEDDITITFNLTNNYLAKVAIDEWMKSIINVDTYLLSYDSDYKRNITISQLDENNSVVYKQQLKSAFPITLNAIELDNNSENTIQKVTVVFAFDPKQDATQAASEASNFIGDINLPTSFTV